MMTHMLMRMAFRAICHHVIRSLLTLLGIVIGIAGIIAISAIGKGAQQKAREQFLAYGAKTVSISSGNWMSPTKKKPKQLTLDDVNAIKSQCPAVQYISPECYKPHASVEYEGNETSADIVGCAPSKLLITEREIGMGQSFTQQHLDRKENVAILPPALADLFFKQKDCIGSIIRINKVPFTVVGVLAPPKVKGKWDGLGLSRIFIPFTTHQKYYGKWINQIDMSTYAHEDVPEVVRQVEKIFRAAHQLEDGESNDFMVWDMQTFAQAAEEASKSVGLFAIIAAFIALLVGGIGVMNIMLVAVQERTKEIGIKGALGATMNIIRMQFLFEAVAICMVGGILGIIFGVGASFVLDHWLGIPAIIELMPVVLAFFFTALIGLGFGFYPAERAARMSPVKALIEY